MGNQIKKVSNNVENVLFMVPRINEIVVNCTNFEIIFLKLYAGYFTSYLQLCRSEMNNLLNEKAPASPLVIE